MAESPSTDQRHAGAVAACVATLPRRLAIIGGFILLGWLGVALVSATDAVAAPTPAASTSTTADPAASAGTQSVLGAAGGPVGSDRSAAVTAPARVDAGEGLVGVTSPITAAASRLSGSATQVAAAAAPVTESATRLSGSAVPVTETATGVAGTAARITTAAARVTGTAVPGTDAAAVSDATARLAGSTKPVTTSLARALTPVTHTLSKPLQDSVGQLAGPASNAGSGLLPVLARTADEMSQGSSPTSALTPSLLAPVLSELLGGTTNLDPEPPGSGVAIPVAAPASGALATVTGLGGTDLPGRPRSSSTVRPADESLAATPGLASASHGPLAGLGVPAPLPALPPVGPDTALAAGSGSTAMSNSGSGTGPASGCGNANCYQHEAPLLGTARSAGSRPVRNSADEPPVSPD